MKSKVYNLLIIFGLLLVGCANEASIEPIAPECSTSTMRTLDEARKIALDAVKMFSDDETKSSFVKRELGKMHIITNTYTKSTETVDTLLYVFDYADNNGFAVVSANEASEPLLAVTERGSYETAMKEDNDGFKMFMNMAEVYASKSRELGPDDMGILEPTEMKTETDTLSIVSINPKVNVAWGDSAVESKYAPNGAAGCVPLAIAQIMSSFAYPSSINISYEGATISSQVLDWPLINRHVGTYDFHVFCSAGDSGHEALSQLLRQLGELTECEYLSSGSTSASVYKAIETFQILGYTTSSLNYYDNDMFNTGLTGNKVIFMVGFETSYPGHAWIVDGSACYNVRKTTYWRNIGDRIWLPTGEYRDYSYKYLHINWGWNGIANGYFSLGVFDTTAGNYDNAYYPNQNATSNFSQGVKYFEVYR